MGVDRLKIRWNGWGWAAHKDELGGREAIWTWLAGELGMPALLATPARPLDELSMTPPALYVEDNFGVHIDDSELNASTFDSLDGLIALIQSRQ